jgi:DNA replication protein DnaC
MSERSKLYDVHGSASVFNIPPSHQDKQLNNYAWSARPQTAKMVEEFMDRALMGQAPHLLLTGAVGTGKTHIAVGLHRWAVAQVGTLRAAFVECEPFFKEVKRTYGKPDVHDPLDDIRAANFMVTLDDPFAQPKMHGGDFSILFNLIGAAHRNRAALVWTMNHTVDQLHNFLAVHEVDRVLEGAMIAEFVGNSWRPGC